MLTTSQVAEILNLSKDRIRDICKHEKRRSLKRFPGAVKFGTSWMIPKQDVYAEILRRREKEKVKCASTFAFNDFIASIGLTLRI